jgi:pimeloyl-ACP methyl ester carboxylesterase
MNLEVIQEKAVGAERPAPLLFVHGMWHAAWCWAEHFLPYLARQGYTCQALSLRGHGGSEGRERLRWTSLADYVADVAQVAGRLPSPPVLVGHSMGGMIVQKYLETHPAPAAVLLASAPPRGLVPATLRVARHQPLAFLQVNLTLSMWPVVSTPDLAREAFFTADMAEDKVQGYFSRLQDESYRAYLDMLALNLPRPKRITTPLLVLGADDDRLITPAEVEATARAYGTRAEILPHLAHDMMLADDWQTAAERIVAWLGERGL